MADFAKKPNRDVFETVQSFTFDGFGLEIWEKEDRSIWVLVTETQHTAVHDAMAGELIRDAL